MTIEGDNTRILARLLEGQFPKYQQMFQPFQDEANDTPPGLLDAVARISIVSGKEFV